MNKEQYDIEIKNFKTYWSKASLRTLENFRDYMVFRGFTECNHPSFFLHPANEGDYTEHNDGVCRLGQQFEIAWEEECVKRIERKRNKK